MAIPDFEQWQIRLLEILLFQLVLQSRGLLIFVIALLLAAVVPLVGLAVLRLAVLRLHGEAN